MPVRCSYSCADQQQQPDESQHWTSGTAHPSCFVYSFTTPTCRFCGYTLSAVFNVEVDQWDLACGCSSLTLFVFAAAESMQVWVSLWAASVCDVWTCPPPVSAAVGRRRNNTKYAFTTKAVLKYTWPGAPFYELLRCNRFYKDAGNRQPLFHELFCWSFIENITLNKCCSSSASFASSLTLLISLHNPDVG